MMKCAMPIETSSLKRDQTHVLAVLSRGLMIVALTLTSLTLPRAALARQSDPQPSPPQPSQTDPVPNQENKDDQEKDKPSSLDDLLGIDEDQKEKSGAEAAAKDADEELKRRLNEKEIANTFSLAVEKMAISAELLDVRFDTGLGTQRVQEEIIKRLEDLINQAKKNQSSRRSSSSSSSQQQQQQQQQNQQQNPGQQRTQNQPQRDEGNQRRDNPSDSREGDPPPLQEGDINTALEESQAEWGNLPPRVRDQLLQGRREKFSSLYERLTQEYYKRLAEEGTP